MPMKSNCMVSSSPSVPPKNVSWSSCDRLHSPSRMPSPVRRPTNARSSRRYACGSWKRASSCGVDAGGLDDERHGVDPEAGDAELEPVAHRLEDLVAHQRVGDVEVGLGPVEAVEVPLTGLLVVLPEAVLLVREDHLLRGVRRFVVAPDVPVAVRRARDERADRNHGCRSLVWLTTRSTITRMPRSRAVRTNSTKSPAVPSRGSTAK